MQIGTYDGASCSGMWFASDEFRRLLIRTNASRTCQRCRFEHSSSAPRIGRGRIRHSDLVTYSDSSVFNTSQMVGHDRHLNTSVGLPQQTLIHVHSGRHLDEGGTFATTGDISSPRVKQE